MHLNNQGVAETTFNDLLTQILKTDVKVGLTFSVIAAQTLKNHSKRERNCRNARIAYDSVLCQLNRARLSYADESEIRANLAKLKTALQGLGESF